jgi:hypothetical protein
VRWDAVGEFRPCPGEERQHVRIRPILDVLSPAADAKLGRKAAALARRRAQSLT